MYFPRDKVPSGASCGHHMIHELKPTDSTVIDATTRHSHGDRKALAKEQAKKIAMGHKADDHEEGQKMN